MNRESGSRSFETQINAICENKVVGFLQQRNSLNEVDKFYKTVQLISDKKEIQQYEILLSMDKFEKIYELFRPYKIESSDYYMGTVQKMEGIFATLYAYLNLSYTTRLKKIDMTPFDYSDKPQKRLNYDKIQWKHLLDDIEDVSLRIKKTICKNAVRLYAIIGQNDALCTESLVIQYIKYVLGTESVSVEFDSKFAFSVKINGKVFSIESEKSLYQGLLQSES